MTTPAQPTETDKARNKMMMGAALVMGGSTFGGLTAVVLMAVNQRVPAGVVAIAAGIVIIVGIVVQVTAVKKMKAAQPDAKGGTK